MPESALSGKGIFHVFTAVFTAVAGIPKTSLAGFRQPLLVFCVVGGIVLVCGNTCLVGQAPRLVVPVGHTQMITSVAFSPNGKMVLTGSEDNTAKLWDTKTGREIQTFTGHSSYVRSVAFSPDGKMVLTGSYDNTAKLWDLQGHEIQTFTGHMSFLWSVAFSPDGQTVLTGSADNTAKLWDLHGRELQSFTGHADAVWSVAFSPDSETVLTGSADSTAKLWDLQGRELQSFTGHTSSVYSVAFSPDGKTVLTGSMDKTAKLWNLKGQALQTFMGHSSYVWSVAFSPDGKAVLTGSFDKSAKLWDLQGHEFKTFTGHASDVRSIAFSPDGKMLLTGSRDKTAKLWDLQGRELQTFTGHSDAINSVAFSPDGKMLLTGSRDKTAKLWGLQRPDFKIFTGHSSDVQSVAFSPDGKTVLTGSRDKTAKLWDLQGRELQTFTGHSSDILSVAFSPDGKAVLTGSEDKTAKLWDLQGRELQTFREHLSDVMSVVFSPGGKTVLTGSHPTAKLWDIKGHILQTITGNWLGAMPVAFSPDGKTVLTSSDDNTANLWDLNGKEIQVFTGHEYWINSVAFSPDGKTVLTGSYDNTAKLWNLQGRVLQPFMGHSSDVMSVAFSPDGKTVLTGSADNTTKIWNVQTGRNLATLIAIDSTDWVITSPSGLFDASPGAMRLMHYMVGLEVIELEQLKERYYEPGLLAKVMGFNPGELRDVSALTDLPLYPEVEAEIRAAQLQIQLKTRNGGLGKLSLFINGKEVAEDINPARTTSLSLDLKTYGKYYLPGDNTLALRAYNSDGWLKSQAYELSYTPALTGNAPLQPQAPPHLYLIAVGTSDYSGDQLDLRFPDLDASAMAQALQAAGSRLFDERVHLRLLNTAAKSAAVLASKTNIAAAFSACAAEAKPGDVLVVYFSGHGVSYGSAEKSQFYYLTKDIASPDLKDPEVRKNYTVSSEELTTWLTAIPAQKQVMILDACNSGKVVESLAVIAARDFNAPQIRALDRMKDRTGMFILTGSAADKVSFEAGQYGQGLLTYSLLQGMSGLALTPDKRVDVMSLFQYARDVVPVLAQDIRQVQVPVLAFPNGGGSFDIGIVDDRVKIPLAQAKPVFIRNNFTNEVSFADDLKLTRALENYFRDITARGAEADLIYVDVSEYENAWSIKGLYTVTGEAVQVRGRLFKGETPQGEFQVSGAKSDIPGLVKKIVEKVQGMI